MYRSARAAPRSRGDVSLRLAPHPPHRRTILGIAALLDRLEAVAFVERAVSSGGSLEVGRQAFGITAHEHAAQQRGAVPAALPSPPHSHSRQVPVRLVGMLSLVEV